MMLTTPVASQKKAFPLADSLNLLSLSESDADLVTSEQLQKILRVTLGYSQILRKSLMALDCAETEELKCIPDMQEIKHGDSPSLPAQRNSLIFPTNAYGVGRGIKGEQGVSNV
ncbi:hypothetical protein [Yersinia kristensenii]|uniref:hypothetical protein n=1 Tax=Yersinia kristensenii TaxID=28152 RepID=UPI000C1EC073|nr:hypothetical protein [Yersinia kristensenii]MDA5473293.1 hypothetical protein [Yersinia kristensenii]MDA5475595.1 hypothetical protein [Yersinia kristensenii]MDA5507109.1 hypothetical protein [Yersinia kristensenii]NIK96034.1 hypothetical protein [Yersinia kristensenii]NIL09020.1 hypothetical protein [Yersinia kristensenii]